MQENGFHSFHPGFLVLIVTEIIFFWPKNSSYFYGPILVFSLFFLFDLKLLHGSLKSNYNLFQLFSIIS